MSEAAIGAVDVTFGSNAFSYQASTGTTDGATVAKVDTTASGESVASFCAGDVKEYSDPTATAFADYTTNVLGLVGTTETLTFTYPISDSANSTNATLVGQAFLQDAQNSNSRDTPNLYDFVWVWEGGVAPVYTAETT